MDLSWQQSAVVALALAALGVVLRTGGRDRRVRVVGLAATETSIVVALYGLWQLVGRLSITNADHALDRADWIWRFQHTIHLPSEVALQRHVLGHALIVQACNLYYYIVHGPALMAFLVWLFVRHRDAYRAQRNTIAIVTGACLAVQFIPVAPPRMLTAAGFVDTGRLYHQSVYGPVGEGMSDQFSAMPSVHVAWAVLIALGVLMVGTGKWRWLIVAHPLTTVFVIVVTANHFWLDGIVAVALIPVAWVARWAGRGVVDLARARWLPVPIDLDAIAGAAPPPSVDLGEEIVH